jgi:hypothetical protein
VLPRVFFLGALPPDVFLVLFAIARRQFNRLSCTRIIESSQPAAIPSQLPASIDHGA